MRVPAPTMRIEDEEGYERCLGRLLQIGSAKVGSAEEAEYRGIMAVVSVWLSRDPKAPTVGKSWSRAPEPR